VRNFILKKRSYRVTIGAQNHQPVRNWHEAEIELANHGGFGITAGLKLRSHNERSPCSASLNPFDADLVIGLFINRNLYPIHQPPTSRALPLGAGLSLGLEPEEVLSI
jgi:hypothetical protein